MKRYECHKVVEAAKIAAVTGASPITRDVPRLELEGNIVIAVDEAWIAKHSDGGKTDLVGGYFVRYEDGYESWSPAAAFEAGYSEVVG